MKDITPLERIENKIYVIRDQKVMLDSDLAELYGVKTKRLNEQVKRNIKRFPEDFMFQLTRYEDEYLEKELSDSNYSLRSQNATSKNANIGKESSLRSQNATLEKSKKGKHKKYSSYVFTEQGVAMLSSVLKSDKAIDVNIAIMRTFVKVKKLVYSYKDLADKITKIEQEHGKKISKIFDLLNYLMKEETPKDAKKEIGFKENNN